MCALKRFLQTIKRDAELALYQNDTEKKYILLSMEHVVCMGITTE